MDRFLQITPVRKRKHLLFNLLTFRYFSDSGYEDPRSIESHRLLAPLVVAPYIMIMEVILLRGKRYFVSLGEQVVGVFATHRRSGSLFVGSLAVSPHYRNLGIATRMLNQANEMAKQLSVKWLELTVVKTNLPALRLYRKFGFTIKLERKRSFVLRKKVWYDCSHPCS
jgi:GNAT superfamily N-acetyltransferase